MANDGQLSGTLDDRPTSVRQTIVGWATLMSLLLYLDRYCISICTNYIRQDLDVTPFVISWLNFAFFLAYALFQVPSGWLTDRIGVRLMLSIFILGWSACTGLQAFVQSFALLALMQLLCGMFQAGAYPAGARLVRDWNPPTARGFGSAMVALGGRIGGALAPILTAWMLVQFVPVSTDSHVTDRTFLNLPAMVQKLVPTETGTQSPRTAYLWGTLSAEDRKLWSELKSTQGEISPEQDQQVRALLNRWIDSREFYQAAVFGEVIEKEGGRLSVKLGKNGELSQPEFERLNRLALEATFPKELGNIYVHGWRPSMLVYGVIGLAVAALFWWGVRNNPAEDPRCNAAERAFILSAEPASKSAVEPVKESFPWRAMLTDLSLWGNCLMQITTNIGWLFLVRSMPQYLEEVHGVPLVMRGIMTSIPIWVGVIGVFTGGRLADSLVKRIGLKWGRRAPILITRFTAASGYLICIALTYLVPKDQAPDWMPWVYVAALSLVAISTDIGVPSVWAFAQDVGGKYTASILGWGNMWGNFGAAVATPLYAYILTKNPGQTEWNLLFAWLAGIFMLGAAGALIMDPTRPLTLARQDSATKK